MASNTPYLDLYKKDPILDGGDTFNIQTMMNDNWDKIDAAHNTHLTNNMPHQFSNIETSKTYKFGFQVSSTGKPQIIYEEVV